MSDDQQKENTEEPKDDVEAHQLEKVQEHHDQVVEFNEEPDVEGHMLERAEMADHHEMKE